MSSAASMTTTHYFQELLHIIHETGLALEQAIPGSVAGQMLAELSDDIRQDYMTIVVVGEFKHGKSTFINALMGSKLMPADVTPTTATINALFHREEPEIRVVKRDHTEEVLPFAPSVLNGYTASADFDPDEIRYIKIFYPSPLLEQRVVIVDTPGVNDLNRHRAEITHQFLPRADLILFMLDMTAPVKKTEQEFLEQHVLRVGTDQLLFVANFADRVDEEELDETLDAAKRRLERILGKPELSLYAVSSLDALEGRLEGDGERLRYSGLPEVEAEIERRLNGGSRAEMKERIYRSRLRLILEQGVEELEAAQELSRESKEDLERQLEAILGWFEKREVWQRQIADYLAGHENEIRFMADKSFRHFADRLREDAHERVHLFHGSDIRGLVESQLPFLIRSQFTQWTDQYGDYIQHMLGQVEQEAARGLQDVFQESVSLRPAPPERLRIETSQPMMDARRGGNPYVKAGLVVGGVSTAALLLGGPFLIPIIGMAGLPFIQQKMAERQLGQAKPAILGALDQHLDELFKQGSELLVQYIGNAFGLMESKLLREFERLMEARRKAVSVEVERKIHAADEEQNHLNRLEAVKLGLLKQIDKCTVEEDNR